MATPATSMTPNYRALVKLTQDAAHHHIRHDAYVDCLIINFADNRPHLVHFLDKHLALLLDAETGEVLGFYIENISHSG